MRARPTHRIGTKEPSKSGFRTRGDPVVSATNAFCQAENKQPSKAVVEDGNSKQGEDMDWASGGSFNTDQISQRKGELAKIHRANAVEHPVESNGKYGTWTKMDAFKTGVRKGNGTSQPHVR